VKKCVFLGKSLGFLKMDKNKCPFSKTYSTFWKKVAEQYNILKQLKE
jgi:hypothetical protein